MVITAVNSLLSYFGIQLTSGIEDSSKPVRLFIVSNVGLIHSFASISSLGLSPSLLSKNLAR